MKIIGKEKVSYLSKKTNKQVEGSILYFTKPIPAEKGEGLSVEKEFVNIKYSNGLEIGDEVEILYNKFGTVQEVRIIG